MSHPYQMMVKGQGRAREVVELQSVFGDLFGGGVEVDGMIGMLVWKVKGRAVRARIGELTEVDHKTLEVCSAFDAGGVPDDFDVETVKVEGCEWVGFFVYGRADEEVDLYMYKGEAGDVPDLSVRGD